MRFRRAKTSSCRRRFRAAPNPYVAALIGVGLAIGATQIVTGIQFLAAVLRRNRRP